MQTLLAPNETIIDAFYMQQLLTYGISLGQGPPDDINDPEKLRQEAEVSRHVSLAPSLLI